MSTALLFGLMVCCVVAVFVGGIIVGMSYERRLRPLSRTELEAAVHRYFEAGAEASRPRAGYIEHSSYASARRHLAALVGWERRLSSVGARRPSASPRAQEIAS